MGKLIKSVNPSTGNVEKIYETLTESELDRKIDDSDKAFHSWRNRSLEQRSAYIMNVAALFEKHKEELAHMAAREMGKIVREGRAEVDACIKILRYYAENSASLLADKKLDVQQGSAVMMYDPIGVILSVQPWNFPYSQVIRNAAPNIMAGNTTIVKHASNVPGCAVLIEDIFKEAEGADDVYINLLIPGSKATEIVSDVRIKGVTLTGSESAGSSIAAEAGKYIKKSVLELGGSDPMLILEDADLDLAVKSAALGRLRNAGQVCTSPKRIIVHENIASEFMDRCVSLYEKIVIGDPHDDQTDLGPLSSEKALDHVMEQIDQSIRKGAKLVYGGERLHRAGSFMSPAILTCLRPAAAAYNEEIFGPVLSIQVTRNDNEAVQIANDTKFGLGASVFSRDIDRAQGLARKIESGMVFINKVVSSSPELPFGGTRHSGYGRELAQEGILEFVNHKLIYTE